MFWWRWLVVIWFRLVCSSLMIVIFELVVCVMYLVSCLLVLVLRVMYSVVVGIFVCRYFSIGLWFNIVLVLFVCLIGWCGCVCVCLVVGWWGCRCVGGVGLCFFSLWCCWLFELMFVFFLVLDLWIVFCCWELLGIYLVLLFSSDYCGLLVVLVILMLVFFSWFWILLVSV